MPALRILRSYLPLLLAAAAAAQMPLAEVAKLARDRAERSGGEQHQGKSGAGHRQSLLVRAKVAAFLTV